MKNIQIVAISLICHVLRIKCTEFNFDWGSAQDPAGEAYSAPQTP